MLLISDDMAAVKTASPSARRMKSNPYGSATLIRPDSRPSPRG